MPQPYIIGGEEAPEQRYPYLASLGLARNDHTCAATLIAPDVLLSAAHCQGSFRWATLGSHKRGEVFDGTIGAGKRTEEEDDTSVTVRIEKTVPHPRYQYTSANPDIEHDFMLIVLPEPLDAGQFPPVRLNRNPRTPKKDGELLGIVGWGATTPTNSDLSAVLRHAFVGYVTPDTCDAADGYISGAYYSYRGFMTSSMMCAWSEEIDACLGDSGGPLLLRGDEDRNDRDDAYGDVQVGVVSFGVGCLSPDFPGIYSRISDQIGWIDETVCSLSVDPPKAFECITKEPTMRPTGAPTEQIVLDLLLEDRVPVEGGNESMAPSDLASSSVSQYGTHLGFKFTTTAIVLFFFATARY